MTAQGQLEKQVADFSKGEAALLNSADWEKAVPTVPEETDETQEDEEIEAILEHQLYDPDNDLWQFKLRWKGLGSKFDSWHLEADLPQLSEMIKDYSAKLAVQEEQDEE